MNRNFPVEYTGSFNEEENVSDLTGVDLREADLIQADLRGSNLAGADLRDADLKDANLEEANLTGCENLTLDQLSRTRTVFGARFEPELQKRIETQFPALFEKPAE